MNVEVTERLGRYAVLVDGECARTPFGHRLESISRDLAEEVAEDIRLGRDPEGDLSMYGLQAAYLDLGEMMARGDLESEIVQASGADVFLERRPARLPELLALWGPPEIPGPAFESSLERLALRELVSVMLSGERFKSPALAWLMLVAHRPLLPLALGNCARLMSHLAAEHGVPVEGVAALFDPGPVDESFCAAHCLQNPDRAHEEESAFGALCPSYRALATLARFASYPEEPQASQAV